MRATTARRYRALTEARQASSSTPSWSAWQPFPGPQAAALASEADEVFYGGAAGGGKTGALVGIALTQHHRSLIIRREATQLREVTSQLLDFAPPGSRWRGVGYGGILKTPDGREVELAGCPSEDDKRRFQGRPHDLKAFDEITELTESQYEYICGWNRTTRPNQRCRKFVTGNPPTHAEGEWVIRRWRPWIDPTAGKRAMPGELRWFARIGDDEEELENGNPFEWRGHTIRPQSRTFIPASLKDNPKLRDTNYASRLASLPPALRDALLEGDFGVALRDDPWQVIPSAWVKAAQRRWFDNPPEGVPLSAAGFDIAYGGSDRTVYVPRHGNWFGMPTVWKGTETASGEKAADLVKGIMGESKAALNVDVIGYGAAAYEFCKKRGLSAWPINFGSGVANWTDRRGVLAFSNLRAFAYWQLRDALDPDVGDSIALPPDPDLLAELTAPRYEMVGGRLKILPKDEITATLGRSPDKADALVLANLVVPRSTFRFEVVTGKKG